MEIVVNKTDKRSWVEIDMTQLRTNYRLCKESMRPGTEVMAVIKADAYGHGDVQVARMLNEEGVRLFAVSNIDEAVGLRKAGVEGEILILGYSSISHAKTTLDYDLTQAIVSEEHAEALVRTGYRIKGQIAIDTGMNRIGIDGNDETDAERIIRKFADDLQITGIFTHLCFADTDTEVAKTFTNGQISKFDHIAQRVGDLQLPYVHCCNSAAALTQLTEYGMEERIGKVARLGIVLYGMKPGSDMVLPAGIRPALEWKSLISQVKDVRPGETIGYGCTYRVEHPMRIATVTTGYADGLNRHLSNRGFVMINGQKAPIVGRVCMDQTMVDVTEIPDVKMGGQATIIGRNGNLFYGADDMALDLDTIGYEVICCISKRVQRYYE